MNLATQQLAPNNGENQLRHGMPVQLTDALAPRKMFIGWFGGRLSGRLIWAICGSSDI